MGALLVTACTGAPARDPGTTPERSPAGGPAPLPLPVLVSLSGPTAASDRPYLDGIRLAVKARNRAGGVAGRPLLLEMIDDRGGDPRDLLEEALGRSDVPAVLAVGDGEPVADLREEIERSRTPVLLFGGDLYSSRRLFRHVFQVSPPIQWQAAVLARYLVRDRRHTRISVVTATGDDEAYRALAGALAEEGAAPPDRVVLRSSTTAAVHATRAADAVVLAVPAAVGGAVATELGRRDAPPQVALLADGLQRAAGRPPPGTVAVGSYAWAGWARPIDRVASFRVDLRRSTGHLPEGAEQQGYDAVFLLASALDDTHGRSGDALVRALERVRTVTLSELPVTLGPDDHLVADRHLLGLFAVAGPGEDLERWAPSWAPWRPLMRTFTLLGMRTSILDMDKRALFPRWRRNQPDPFYWQARFGIVTRPEDDPLH